METLKCAAAKRGNTDTPCVLFEGNKLLKCQASHIDWTEPSCNDDICQAHSVKCEYGINECGKLACRFDNADCSIICIKCNHPVCIDHQSTWSNNLCIPCKAAQFTPQLTSNFTSW